MVDRWAEQGELPSLATGQDRWAATATAETRQSPGIRVRLRTFAILFGVIITVVGALALAATMAGNSARASTSIPTGRGATHARGTATQWTAGAAVSTATPTTLTTTTASPTNTAAPQAQAVATAVSVSPVAPTESVASIGALVDQVEAAGIEPGPDWTWSIGDTAAHCGTITDSGAASGCTYWASGVERTLFAGSPSLALVAHEVANAETESDAVPSLMAQVAASEAGTSWSTTDAVASCLVDHSLGFQDDAAGFWQCPVALASYVADHIHDLVVTSETKAVCGAASGVSSTLTFTADAGILTVTDPAGGSAPGEVPAGTSVTVSGIGTFTAVDQGGTVSESGLCEA
jgi:hypothetical protein